MLNTKLVTWALGLWAAITFVVCAVYGLVTPQSLGMQGFLEMVLPAFTWLTWWGFLLAWSRASCMALMPASCSVQFTIGCRGAGVA